jgi:hypothetical protein
MANNRMRLFHRPSDNSVLLGKRMGFGWYTQPGMPVTDELNKFFDECEDASDAMNQDDFVLALSDVDEGSGITQYFYKDDGTPTLVKPDGHDAPEEAQNPVKDFTMPYKLIVS